MTLSEATRLAFDWYKVTRKEPKLLVVGQWRWVLPEIGQSDGRKYELPGEVFDQLRSTEDRNWLFTSKIAAETAARMAASKAILFVLDN